jgi:hypothetical protein
MEVRVRRASELAGARANASVASRPTSATLRMPRIARRRSRLVRGQPLETIQVVPCAQPTRRHAIAAVARRTPCTGAHPTAPVALPAAVSTLSSAAAAVSALPRQRARRARVRSAADAAARQSCRLHRLPLWGGLRARAADARASAPGGLQCRQESQRTPPASSLVGGGGGGRVLRARGDWHGAADAPAAAVPFSHAAPHARRAPVARSAHAAGKRPS